MRQGGAHQVLSVGTVDIDEALVRIHPRALVDSFLQTLQSHNARQYEVIFYRMPVPVTARIFSRFENTPCRSAVPDLLRDAMETRRCFERVLSNTIAETGGGSIVLLDDSVLRADKEPLCLNRLDEKKFFRVG